MIHEEKVFYEHVVDDVKITVTDRYIKVGSATYDIRHVQAVKRYTNSVGISVLSRAMLFFLGVYLLPVVLGFLWVSLPFFLAHDSSLHERLGDYTVQGHDAFFYVMLLGLFFLLLEWFNYILFRKKREPYRVGLVFAGIKLKLYGGYLYGADDAAAEQLTLDAAILQALEYATNRTVPSVREVLDQIAANMVAVEGGKFLMGASPDDPEALDRERPQHCVKVEGFQISRYLVTQAQWTVVMGSNPSLFSGCDDCPVEGVSWDDTQEFIRKLNLQTGKSYRLPTETEWEFAARGGNKSKGYKYAGGNDLGSVAWYVDNSESKTHPVGQKQANELGLYDMSGNVWEWCSDWYDAYPLTAQTNPRRPSSMSGHALRGGSWLDGAKICRLSFRISSVPDYHFYYGFRLVLP